MVQVQKQSGQVMTFDKHKISGILTTVGLSVSEATTVADSIEKWAESLGRPVSTQEIKRKVLELIPREVALKIRQFVKNKRGGSSGL